MRNPFKQIISARKPFGLNTSFRGLKKKKDKRKIESSYMQIIVRVM